MRTVLAALVLFAFAPIHCGPPDIETDCANGVDDDIDDDVDCDDDDCTGTADCGGLAEICDNENDDDADGALDCDDTECSGDPHCSTSSVEICGNEVDDDGDGDADCADSDCFGSQCPEVCDNLADDDGDGLTDCDDSDCDTDPACYETDCDDGVDNDNDGPVDCLDPDCATDPACTSATETVCDNGSDDDSDTLIDCADDDCWSDPSCTGTGCGAIDLGSAVSPPDVATGTETVTMPNNVTPSCGYGLPFGEALYVWTAPKDDVFLFTTGNSAGTIALLLGCGGPEIPGACSHATYPVGPLVATYLYEGQPVIVVVEDTDATYALQIVPGEDWPL